jgi:hypothetical protein
MIQIEKYSNIVKVHLPIETITFDLDQFNEISDNIYLIRYPNPDPSSIIREKGTIEELNMGHWLCLKKRYQSNFNDPKLKSLDIEFLIKEHII